MRAEPSLTRVLRYFGEPWRTVALTLFVISLVAICRCGCILGLLAVRKQFKLAAMNNPIQPNVKLTNDPNYRENYANSVQMRVNIWDFFLVFGTLQQQSESQVDIRNFQGIYLSPQQAKALLGLLQQNVAGYESAFGEIKLDPRMSPSGPVH